jgi:hypothetical protein
VRNNINNLKLNKMGSCSNRPLSREEKIAKFAKEVSKHRYSGEDSESDWQCSVGAKIRGELGIEKGNAFIKAVQNATRRDR